MSTVQGGQGNIVTNGLILNLDAANPRSYEPPFNGTTWQNLVAVSSSISGLLTNGPVFSTSGSGCFLFDGTNDHVNCGSVFNYTTQNFSFSYWIYFNSFSTNIANQGPITLYKGQYIQNGYYAQVNSSGSIGFLTNNPGTFTVSSTDNGSLVTGSWCNITHVRSGSSIRTYINGIDRTTTASIHPDPSSTGNNFLINTYNTFIYGNTKIGSFYNYNRALNASEVLQNFNATRARFGV